MAVLAYQALRESKRTGAEKFEALLKGVSTRNYREVVPRPADRAGVSKSAVSRESVETAPQLPKRLLDRRWRRLPGPHHGNITGGSEPEGSVRK